MGVTQADGVSGLVGWEFFCHVTFSLTGFCSNLANAASLLWHAYKSLPSPSCEVNWTGRTFQISIEHQLTDS
jgi:hypothetical protein